MTVVCTRTVVRSGFQTFVLGPSMLAVQPIAGTASGMLPIAASAEGPSAESQTTSPKTQNKDGIQWGPATGIRRLGEAVHMSGSECDSLKCACMLAYRAQATTSLTSSVGQSPPSSCPCGTARSPSHPHLFAPLPGPPSHFHPSLKCPLPQWPLKKNNFYFV